MNTAGPIRTVCDLIEALAIYPLDMPIYREAVDEMDGFTYLQLFDDPRVEGVGYLQCVGDGMPWPNAKGPTVAGPESVIL